MRSIILRCVVMIAVALVTAYASPAPTRDIVFARRAAGDRTVPLQLWRMGPDGSNPRPFFTDTAGLGSMNTPDWSPDGTRLVFDARLTNDEPAFFVANGDGSGVTTST